MTRIELIESLRDCQFFQSVKDRHAIADMLEADEAEFMSGYEGGKHEARNAAHDEIDKLQAAARLALDALTWVHGGEPLPTLEAEAIAALKEALK